MAEAKPTKPPFGAIHRHGFVRVAAASPRASAGDVAFNVEQTLDARPRGGRERGVDLAVFPELNLSSYAVDDLFLQDAFLDAVEAGIGRLAAESADLAHGAAGRRAAAAQRAALQLRACASRAAGSSASCRRPSCPITANITRSAGSRRGVGLEGLKIDVAGQNVPVRHRPDLRRRGPRRLRLPYRDLRGLSGRRSRPRRSARWPAR